MMNITGYMAARFTDDDGVEVETFDTEPEAQDFVAGYIRSLVCPVVDVEITEG